MSTRSLLKGQPGRPVRIPADGHKPSGTPIVVDVSSPGRISGPVSLARELKLFGLSLSDAHAVLNELKETRSARVQIYVSEMSGPPAALERFGLTVLQGTHRSS